MTPIIKKAIEQIIEACNKSIETDEDPDLLYAPIGRSDTYMIRNTLTTILNILQDDAFHQRLIKSMEWMIKDLKWRYSQTGIEPNSGEPEYSPELKEAIKILKELKNE